MCLWLPLGKFKTYIRIATPWLYDCSHRTKLLQGCPGEASRRPALYIPAARAVAGGGLGISVPISKMSRKINNLVISSKEEIQKGYFKISVQPWIQQKSTMLCEFWLQNAWDSPGVLRGKNPCNLIWFKTIIMYCSPTLSLIHSQVINSLVTTFKMEQISGLITLY